MTNRPKKKLPSKTKPPPPTYISRFDFIEIASTGIIDYLIKGRNLLKLAENDPIIKGNSPITTTSIGVSIKRSF